MAPTGRGRRPSACIRPKAPPTPKRASSLFCMPFTVTEPVITSCRLFEPLSRVKSHIFLKPKPVRASLLLEKPFCKGKHLNTVYVRHFYGCFEEGMRL